MRRVSIIMPAYNCGKYIAAAIESVLQQTHADYELLVVDDGSIDNTTSIAASYNDDRIVLIREEHRGIVHALNVGLDRASGDYVARMDADDRIHPDRLMRQVEYMDEHPEVGVLGTGMSYFGGDRVNQSYSQSGIVTLDQMRSGNRIVHASVMMRSEIAKSIRYSDRYPHAEDLHLWIELIKRGVVIANIPDILYHYRIHDGQTGCLHGAVQMESSRLMRYELMSPVLTVIIPFRNEGEWVRTTVQSIRSTALNCEILLIDDASDDGYDYISIADADNCQYYRNESSLGTGGSRDIGVYLCNTPYFVQIDGHMQFYDSGWDYRLVCELRQRPNALICSNTVGISDLKNTPTIDIGVERNRSRGAVINLREPGWEMTSKWRYETYVPSGVAQVPSVLGAVYAASKAWWIKIKGLHGTIGYGGDEPLMSVKTWLAGGEVLIMDNWEVGHLYRKSPPYTIPHWCVIYNALYTIALLCPERAAEYYDNYRIRVGSAYAIAKSEIDARRDQIDAHRDYLNTQVFTRDFEWFEKFNNQFISNE